MQPAPRSVVRALSSSARVPDYNSFLSRRSQLRRPSPIRALQPLLSIPGMISLGGGMPNASLFPFVGVRLGLRDGTQLELPDDLMRDALQYTATP